MDYFIDGETIPTVLIRLRENLNDTKRTLAARTTLHVVSLCEKPKFLGARIAYQHLPKKKHSY